MPIRFQCPACNAIRSASDRLIGREIRCPVCEKPVQLPTQAELDSLKVAKKAVKQQEREATALQAVEVVEVVPEAKVAVVQRADPPDPPIQFRRPAASSADDMDMTPMVDVTFLLLIFFMVTASFSIQKTVQRPAKRVDAPSRQTIPKDDDANVVTVQVDEFNAYSILSANSDETVSSKQDLIIALSRAHEGGTSGTKPTKLIIQAHSDCLHGAVINALDAGREAQFENFEVTTVEQFD